MNAEGEVENITAADPVAPINAIGATFISNMKVILNGQEIYNSNGLNSYKTYLDLLLTYPKTSVDSYLSAVGWYHTKAQDDVNDPGFQARRALFVDGDAQFVTKIFSPLFTQSRYLCNHSTLELEIEPAKEQYCIVAPNANDQNAYSLAIISCKLYTKTLDLTDGVGVGWNAALLKQPALYPIRQAEMKHFFVSPTQTEYVATLFTEQIPRRITMGLIRNASFSPASRNSPFKFVHGNVRSITVSANGQNYPSAGYQMNFAENQYIRAFHDLHENVGYAFANESMSIDRNMFKNGNALYVFNLTTDQEDGNSFDLIRRGVVTVKIQFTEAVPAGGYVLIVAADHDRVLMVDSSRSVNTDLTP
ncbi:unnamed protein product [Bursaphelenchus xylophilus]|nr:unnamed protein product [Bursaphelenchus xylophilus]CAG9079644.1 unnamed protein product [Bursaphelenchus xylophilus]